MLACIEDLLAREDPLFFPPVLHMGKLIPTDLEQCVCLNKVYFAARYDPEAARCLKSNGLPVPKLRLKKTDKSDA
jgi:hypothetical protein